MHYHNARCFCRIGGDTISGSIAQEDYGGSNDEEVEKDCSHRRVIGAANVRSASLPLLFVTMLLAAIRTGGGLVIQPMATRRCLPPQTYSLNPLELKMSMSDDDDELPSMQLQTSPARSLSSKSQITSTKQQHNGKHDFIISKQQLPQAQIQFETLSRILIPSLMSSVLAYTLFPSLALGLSYLINDSATFAVLSVDSSQFIQNFLTVTGLTFSILVGQTYYFMYQQQEAVFVSLFWEVTEAKSLLEQVALVSQGRRDMYEICLVAVKRCVFFSCTRVFRYNCTLVLDILSASPHLKPYHYFTFVTHRYVEEDLKEGLGTEPAKVLSARPIDDPLEIIMYMTR